MYFRQMACVGIQLIYKWNLGLGMENKLRNYQLMQVHLLGAF